MLHSFRGRVWSDAPEPLGEDAYRINKVSLKVARGESKGRWEAHDNSRTLLLRFDQIGRNGLEIVGMQVAGEAVPSPALSLYLKSGRGLKYFRRLPGFTALNRATLVNLLSRIGIPQKHVTRLQPGHKISAGLGDAQGIGEDRGLSPHRGQWFLGK